MADSVPLQIAETIQTASIKRAPSPSHDLNPSTAASSKQPVSVHQQPASDSSEKYTYDDYGLDEDEEDIPYSVIKPVPRRRSFGPLPDLRFEQSYLASIAGAETKGRVAWITIRDQVTFQSNSVLKGVLMVVAGFDSIATRHAVDTGDPRMAVLQSDGAVERE
jgi:hypothetical protein